MIVYYLENKITGEMYIGATHHTIWYRVRAHLNLYHSKTSRLSKSVTEYGKENFAYGVLHKCSSQEEMHLKEKEEISKVPKNLLFNKIKSGIPRLSKTRAEKIGLAHLGMKHSEESKKKMRDSKIGKSNWPNGRPVEQIRPAIEASAKKRSIPIVCLNNGKIYKSSTEAANDLGLVRSTVHQVANGKRTSCFGYKFRRLPLALQ